MPASEKHRSQHISNLKTIELLKTMDEPPYDWIVTIYFYAALHIIEMKLAEYDFHSGDHGKRNISVQTYFKNIHVYYESLYIESQAARYDFKNITKGKAGLAENHFNMISKHLI